MQPGSAHRWQCRRPRVFWWCESWPRLAQGVPQLDACKGRVQLMLSGESLAATFFKGIHSRLPAVRALHVLVAFGHHVRQASI